MHARFLQERADISWEAVFPFWYRSVGGLLSSLSRRSPLTVERVNNLTRISKFGIGGLPLTACKAITKPKPRGSGDRWPVREVSSAGPRLLLLGRAFSTRIGSEAGQYPPQDFRRRVKYSLLTAIPRSFGRARAFLLVGCCDDLQDQRDLQGQGLQALNRSREFRSRERPAVARTARRL